MSDEFMVDTESLAQFQAAARRVSARVDDQRRIAPYAALPPGAYTRTAGGDHCDQIHAALVSYVGDLLEVAGQVCGALAEAAGSALTAYQGTDDSNAAIITEVIEPPARGGGHRL